MCMQYVGKPFVIELCTRGSDGVGVSSNGYLNLFLCKRQNVCMSTVYMYIPSFIYCHFVTHLYVYTYACKYNKCGAYFRLV